MNPTRTSTSPRPTRGRTSPYAPTEDRALAMLTKAMGHPARVAILRLLIRRGECMCGAIVDELPLAQATVSQHLKVLKDAGLVQGEIDGPRVCYCVNPAGVRRIKDLIQGL